MHADGTSDARWRLAPAAERALVERFDDEIILFNPAAWTTHYLNAAAALLFDELVDGPRTPATLAAALAEGAGEPGGPELAHQVEGALRDLQSIGLVIREAGPQ